MDFNAIIQVVSSVGFPICMSVYLVYYMQTDQKEMKNAIYNLTEAITRLTEDLKKDEN